MKPWSSRACLIVGVVGLALVMSSWVYLTMWRGWLPPLLIAVPVLMLLNTSLTLLALTGSRRSTRAMRYEIRRLEQLKRENLLKIELAKRLLGR